MKKLLIGFTFAAIVVGLYSLTRHHDAPSAAKRSPNATSEHPQTQTATEHAEQVARALARLAAEQDDLRRRLEALGQASAPATTAPAPSLTTDNLDPSIAPAPLSIEDQVELAVVTLDESVRTEPVDASWAKPAEASIAKGAGTVDGLSLERVECRSSLCRIEVTFANLEARDTGTRGLAHAVPWETVAFYRAAPDDPKRMVMYVAREGMTLPTPEG